MSDLSPTARLALDALWAHSHMSWDGRASEVRAWLAAAGYPRSLPTVRRALQQLVENDYAKRHDIRHGEHGRRRAHYYPTRRHGETLPVVCEGSKFLTWLWDARMSWELWSLELSERMARVDNWAMQATPAEWAWLLSRPLDFASGPLRPDNPAWWEHTSPDDGTTATPAGADVACRGQRAPARAHAGLTDPWEDAVRPLLSETEMQERLDVSVRQLREMAALGDVIALRAVGGKLQFPAWQLGNDGRPLEALATAHRTLVRDGKMSPWSAASWCVHPHPELAGRSPQDWARGGESPERLTRVASRDASRAAQ